jgi:hypothetical protein
LTTETSPEPPVDGHAIQAVIVQVNILEFDSPNWMQPKLVVYTVNPQWATDPNVPSSAEVHVVPSLDAIGSASMLTETTTPGIYCGTLAVNTPSGDFDIDYVYLDAVDDTTYLQGS